MARLFIDESKCISCGICENICKFNGVILENNIPVFNANCKFCNDCVKECPTSAIEFEEEIVAKFDTSPWKGVMVYLEMDGGKIADVSYELLGKARELATKLHEEVLGVIISDVVNYDELSCCGADKVYVLEHDEFNGFKLDLVGDGVYSIIKEVKPSILLVGATNLGKTIVPYVSVKCKTGMTADCTKLEIDENGNLIQIRPAFGGNIMAEILTENSRPQIATVREKIFQATENVSIETEIIKANVESINSKYQIEKVIGKIVDKDISKAKILIAIGNAINKKEDIALFQNLADAIGGELCSSRALVERGLMPLSRQVGLSGKAVSADVMFTFGISGSAQFLAGVGGVKNLIAVNEDESANIMKVANHGIVGDIYELSEEILKMFIK